MENIKNEERDYSEFYSFMTIPTDKVVEAFGGYTIPKKVRMNVMINILRPFVARSRYECLLLDPRKNYRLLWFTIYSEFQLNNLFKDFYTEDLAREYIGYFFAHIFEYLNENDRSDIVNKIKALEKTYSKTMGKSFVINDIVKYNNELNSIFVDEEGLVDGIKIDDFRPILYNSATQEEMFQLALKYDIEIPEKLNGDPLREYVREKLKALGKMTPAIEKDFDTITLTKVKEIGKKNGVYISVGLNKKETIEYFLQRALQTKDTYKVPASDSVYQMSIPIDQAEDKYSEMYFEYMKLTEELEEAKTRMDTLAGEEREALGEEIKKKEEMITGQKDLLSELQKQLESGEQIQAELEKKIEESEGEKDELRAEIEALKEQLVKQQERYDTKLYSLTEERIDLIDQFKMLEDATRENEKENIKKIKEELAKKEEAYSKRLEVASGERDLLLDNITKITEEMEILEKEREENDQLTEEALIEQEARIAKLKEDLERERLEKQKSDEEIESLKDMQKQVIIAQQDNAEIEELRALQGRIMETIINVRDNLEQNPQQFQGGDAVPAADPYGQPSSSMALALYDPLAQQQNTLVPYTGKTDPWALDIEEETPERIKNKRLITTLAYTASVAFLALLVFLLLLFGTRN